MHIWIFNPFDDLPWEGKPQRYATLARSLAERGHNVVHWSSDFSHRLKEKRQVPKPDVMKELRYQVEFIPSPSYLKNVSLARVWSHSCFGRGLLRLARKAVSRGEYAKPDIILASMPPVESPSAALSLKKDFGCKVILDVMDTWPTTLLSVFPSKLQWFGKALLTNYILQFKRACREADAISAQSQKFADFALRNGSKSQSMHVCYLGADPVVNSTVATKRNRPLRLLYLGAMGRSYDLETLLDAVELVNSHELKVELVLVGDGEKRTMLEARQVPNVLFTGYLASENLDVQLRDSDVGIVPFLPESGVSLPYKAAEYLAYGMPLISSIEGELGELLRRYSCGSVYAARDACELANSIERYLRDDGKLEVEKQAAKNCFKETFDRNQIYPQFVNWIEGILDK